MAPALVPVSELDFKVELTLTADGLDLVSAAQSESDEPLGQLVPVALVKLFLDGHELLKSTTGRPFDALALMTLGVNDGEVDLYTCSCGVAGCAGFGDPVTVEVLASTVRWTIPVEGYQPGEPGPDAQPTVVQFSLRHYRAALLALEALLTAEAGRHPTLQVLPCDPDEEAFLSVWPSMRTYADLRRQRAAQAQTVSGDLHGGRYLLSTPLGAMGFSIARLFNSVCPGWPRTHAELQTDIQAWTEFVAALRADPVAAIQTLDWVEVQFGVVMLDASGDFDADAPEPPDTCPDDFWCNVHVECQVNPQPVALRQPG